MGLNRESAKWKQKRHLTDPMTRHILIRDKATEKARLISEQKIAQESLLHEAIRCHPELIPVTDFELGDLVVVGEEAALGGGYADLLCIDASGQIVIIELKRGPENPDSRRVVAQVLGYGAHLWQMTPEEFEQRALTYLHSERCANADLRNAESLQDVFGLGDARSDADEQDQCEEFDLLAAIGDNLLSGRFAYLIVSSRVDASLRRVMEYLNSTASFRVGAVEIDHFGSDENDLFVPRSIPVAVVRRAPAPQLQTSRDRFLSEVTPESRDFFEDLLDGLEELGFVLRWGKKGVACRLPVNGKELSLLVCYPPTAWWLKNGGANELEAMKKFLRGGQVEGKAIYGVWIENLQQMPGWDESKASISRRFSGPAPEGLLETVLAAGDVVTKVAKSETL